MTAAAEPLPADWSDQDHKAYRDNVETWLELGRTRQEAESAARAMVERWRAPCSYGVRM